MTDPKQEMRERAAEFAGGMEDCIERLPSAWDHDDFVAFYTERLSTFANAERDRARELACGAVCEDCKAGFPVTKESTGIYIHGRAINYPRSCAAMEIHRAFEEER